MRSLLFVNDTESAAADAAATLAANNTCASFGCFDTSISGESLVQSIWVNCAIGAFFFILFVTFRTLPIYAARRTQPGVKHRPPALRIDGHRRIWSWLRPVFAVSDREFLKIAGFDSLMIVRITAFGVAFFAPLTFLGLVVCESTCKACISPSFSCLRNILFSYSLLSYLPAVVPLNYLAGDYIQSQVGTEGVHDLTYGFLLTTITNINRGSPLLWVHFCLLVIFIAWASFLLIAFYEESIAMRQMQLNLELQELRSEMREFGAVELEELAAQKPLNGNIADQNKGEAAANTDTASPALDAPPPGSAPAHVDLESGQAAVGTDSHVNGTSDLNLWSLAPCQLDNGALLKPFHAGFYSVLVVDEATHRFSVRQRGLVRLGRSNTLIKAQNETDADSNAYWLKETRRINTLRRTVGGEGTTPLDPEAAAMVAAAAAAARAEDSEDDEETSQKVYFRAQHAEHSTDKAKAAVQEVCARLKVVDGAFRRVFGAEYDRVVPLYDTKKVDDLLEKLYKVQGKRDRLAVALKNDALGADKRQKLLTAEEATGMQEEVLRGEVLQAQQQALDSVPSRSFLALFHTATAAAQASSLDLNPINWRALHVGPGADPENINWPALQRSFRARLIRALVMVVPIIVLVVFPIGALTGLFSQLGNDLCTPTGGNFDATGTWFCEQSGAGKFARSLLTGFLPSLIMTLYQSLIVGRVGYMIAQAESRHFTLSALDRRCGTLYFAWNMVAFFLVALLDGTIFSGLRAAIEDPAHIWVLLGVAIPESSLFFVNYVMIRALFLSFFRLFMPHYCAVTGALRSLRLWPKPKTERDATMLTPPCNLRMSREIGIIFFSVFICSLSYSVICPIISPFALIYFFIL